MQRSPQLKFAGKELASMRAFGGILMRRAAYRRARPLSTKQAMHLVLRSSQAEDTWSFLTPKNRKIIDAVLNKFANRYGVRVYQRGVARDHIHLLVRMTNRFAYRAFIRALTGAIALKVTGANRLRGLKKRFWDYRPFSRVVDWGRGYSLAKDYVLLNQLEGMGLIPFHRGRLSALFRPLLKGVRESSA